MAIEFTPRGFEIAPTVTGGVQIYCMCCFSWCAEWGSRSLFPRLLDLSEACVQHATVCEATEEQKQSLAEFLAAESD